MAFMHRPACFFTDLYYYYYFPQDTSSPRAYLQWRYGLFIGFTSWHWGSRGRISTRLAGSNRTVDAILVSKGAEREWPRLQLEHLSPADEFFWALVKQGIVVVELSG